MKFASPTTNAAHSGPFALAEAHLRSKASQLRILARDSLIEVEKLQARVREEQETAENYTKSADEYELAAQSLNSTEEA